MGSMLRDWLGARLEKQLAAALEWKSTQPRSAETKQKIKQELLDDGDHDMIDADDEAESDFSYEHNNIYIENSFEGGENTYLQVKDFDAHRERFAVVLSDGRTSIRAEFDEDALRLFEKRHQRRLTQIVGGIINPSEFTIRATPLGDKQLQIVIIVKNFTYRKGSANTGTVGHPKPAHERSAVFDQMQQFRELLKAEMMSQLHRASEGGEVTMADSIPEPKRASDLLDDMPASQVEPASQYLATQAPARTRQRKRTPEVSIAQGTNLARPVELQKAPQVRKDPTAALSMLQQLGISLQQQPHIEPPQQIPAYTISNEVTTLSNFIDPDSDDRPATKTPFEEGNSKADETVSTRSQYPAEAAARVALGPSKSIEELEFAASIPDSRQVVAHDSEAELARPCVGQPMSPDRGLDADTAHDVLLFRRNPPQSPGNTTLTRALQENDATHSRVEPSRENFRAVEEIIQRAVESSTWTDMRRPNPKYVKYARRRLDKFQRELIEKPISWYPSGSQTPFPSHNIPADVLKEITAAHNDNIHVNREGPSRSKTSAVDDAEIEDLPQAGDGGVTHNNEVEQTVNESSQPISCWSSSPERHLKPPQLYKPLGRDELPIDSSAQSRRSSSFRSDSDNAMDLEKDSEEESDGSDDSEMPEAVPRSLRPENSQYNRIIKATPFEYMTNARTTLRAPTQQSSSIVFDSTARLSGHANAKEELDPSVRVVASPAKRALEASEQTTPKPKRLHRPPVEWGTDEECEEDPATTWQRQRSEQLHRKREQFPAEIGPRGSPLSNRQRQGSERLRRDFEQIPSASKAPGTQCSRSLSEHREESHLSHHNSLIPFDQDNTSDSRHIIAYSSPSKLTDQTDDSTPAFPTQKKCWVESINAKLGSDWFVQIPEDMRPGIVVPIHFSKRLLDKIEATVKHGDDVQSRILAWQKAIERRCSRQQQQHAGVQNSHSTTLALLPCDVVEAQKDWRPNNIGGESTMTKRGLEANDRNPAHTSHASNGEFKKVSSPVSAQQLHRDSSSNGAGSEPRPSDRSSQRVDRSMPSSAEESSSTRPQISSNLGNAFMQQRGHDSLRPKPNKHFPHSSPVVVSSASSSFDASRGHASLPPRPNSSFPVFTPSGRSSASPSVNARQGHVSLPPRPTNALPRFPQGDDSSQLPGSNAPHGSRNQQQHRQRSPFRESRDRQQDRPRPPPRRWPQETKYPAKESVFAKFAKNYSELKLVKHEKKMVGLDGSRDKRRIDVLGWKI